jgi:hypothetical protein
MINEEISTIFVVGFPDDMQEREFQNMFIFSPGFEAATLKIPQKDSSDDDASANGSTIGNGTISGNGNNARKQIVCNLIESFKIFLFLLNYLFI